jgi:hypothetical protein
MPAVYMGAHSVHVNSFIGLSEMRQCNSPGPKLYAVVDPDSDSVQELAHKDRPWSALVSVKAGEYASSTLSRGLGDTGSFDRLRSTSSSNCDIQALIEFKSLIMRPLDAVYCMYMRVGACDRSNNPVNANISFGSDIVSGSGHANLDLALSRTIAFNWPHEKSSLEFRAEFYNALNHPQFANPDTNFTSPTFGVINSTAVNARVGQLALKFGF